MERRSIDYRAPITCTNPNCANATQVSSPAVTRGCPAYCWTVLASSCLLASAKNRGGTGLHHINAGLELQLNDAIVCHMAAGSLKQIKIPHCRGGGGLHGLTAGGSLGDREAMNGVDMLYLKNVLLKFVEAHALGRLAEVPPLLFC